MTAEDVAKDIEASGLATHIHDSLTSAYNQGAAFVRGQLDAVQVRYDNAFADWVMACESGTISTLDARYAQYQQAIMACAHEWAGIIGHENIPG